MNTKPRVVKDYDRLDETVLELIKLTYPYGFLKHLITFKNAAGKFVSALPFEAEDKYYLVRMTKLEAVEIIEDDDDYDEDGNLKDDVKEDYEDKQDGPTIVPFEEEDMDDD